MFINKFGTLLLYMKHSLRVPVNNIPVKCHGFFTPCLKIALERNG